MASLVSFIGGTKTDWVRGLLRCVGLIISIIPFALGLIWAAFDSRKQGGTTRSPPRG